MAQNWPKHLQPVSDLPEPKKGARAPSGSESLNKFSKAQRQAAHQGTVGLRAAREEAQREFLELMKKNGFKSETEALSAVEKTLKIGPLPQELSELRDAAARLRTATSDLLKEEEKIGEAYSRSDKGRKLLKKASKEAEEKSSAMHPAPAKKDMGKWAHNVGGNIKHNLFNAERPGGELAFNWLFTGLGCMLVADGARRLLSKPPSMIAQDENGNMVATKKQRTAGDVAWGILSLGLGAFNIYYSALNNQRGRTF